MKAYLGEILLEPSGTLEFSKYGPSDWALYFIERYGQIDGEHHKLWVLDQVARILNGTPIIIKLASWSNGTSEYRISTGEPSPQYFEWVSQMRAGEDGPNTYGYDIGIAP